MNFSPLDILFSCCYFALVMGVSYWVASRKNKKRSAEDYFLASKSLPWWVIGASIVASNISAEQFIGMSGSGFVMGLAIATYEWIAAPMLIIIAKWFMPIYLELKIFTMPEFLERRYNKTVRSIMAVFWILLYVGVNLTSVLFLGGLSIHSLLGVDLGYAIVGLMLFSLLYSVYGGMISVAWTDVIHVIFLLFGGVLTSVIALNVLGDGQGTLAGFTNLMDQVPEKFDLIFSTDNTHYAEMPGWRTIFGGLWVLGLSYWGCSQYITQRAIAAKNLKEAQSGLLFAGYLKLLMPFIIVVPGIIVSVLNPELEKPDGAYPWLMNNLLPSGVKGITFAALIAAIVSSLSSMTNSVSTIFTMDIYKEYINKHSSDKRLVNVGRLTAFIALIVATIIAPRLDSLSQVFLFVQEFTGFISPAIFALFFFGLFWSKTTTRSVILASIGSIPISAIFYFFLPELGFLDRILIVFLLLSAIIISVSLVDKEGKGSQLNISFKTSRSFNALSWVLMVVLVIIYWWFS